MSIDTRSAPRPTASEPGPVHVQRRLPRFGPLGLYLGGVALGETLAIALVLSASGGITFNLISNSNPSTIASNIALRFPEATGLDVNTLIASGLALFLITLAVNMIARWIVNRRADFSGAN